jgi:hypothetical protein
LSRGLYKPALAGIGSDLEPETIDVEIVPNRQGLPDRIQTARKSTQIYPGQESTSNSTVNGAESSHTSEPSQDPDSQETPKT